MRNFSSSTDFPDYFSIFKLPIAFSLDLEQLENIYLQLQCQFHPDRYILKNESEKILSLAYTTYINEAFKTLRSSLRRAVYLLNLLGLQVDHQDLIRPSKEILLEQIEFREALEIAAKNNNLPEIKRLKQTAKNNIKECEISFGKQYDKQELPLAIRTLQKWLFWEKTAEEINKLFIDI